jgi:hypothetical protein
MTFARTGASALSSLMPEAYSGYKILSKQVVFPAVAKLINEFLCSSDNEDHALCNWRDLPEISSGQIALIRCLHAEKP